MGFQVQRYQRRDLITEQIMGAKNWQTNLQISDDYHTYCAKCLNMLLELQFRWDGHFGLIKAAKHRIELTSGDARLIHSAPYQSDSQAREFEKLEIDNMFARTWSHWPNQNGQFTSCSQTRKTEHSDFAETTASWLDNSFRTLIPYRASTNVSTLLGITTIFSTLNSNSNYLYVEVPIKISTKPLTCLTTTTMFYANYIWPKDEPRTFQRSMDIILSLAKWHFPLAHLDDTIIC